MPPGRTRLAAPSRRPSPSSTPGTSSGRPVIFVVWVGSLLTTVLAVVDPSVFAVGVTVWLWVTVRLRQPGRGRRRGARQGPGGHPARGPHRDRWPVGWSAVTRRYRGAGAPAPSCGSATSSSSRPARSSPATATSSRAWPRSTSRRSPASRARHPRVRRRPVRRHRRHDRAVGPDRRARSPAKPGETFIDRMIALVEGAARQKTPNEIALTILLTTLTIIFLLAVRRHPADGHLLRRAPVARGARRAAGLPHPDHDRCAAVRHRHRRHGPPGAAQRARHVRPGRRGRRRRVAPCCSTRPAPSPSATARPSDARPRRRRRPRASCAGPPTSSASPTRPPRAARSSSSLRRGIGPGDRLRCRADARPARRSCRSPPRPGCPASTCPTARGAQGRRPPVAALGRGPAAGGSPDDLHDAVDGHRALRRHPARRRAQREPASAARALGRRPPQGRRQAGHARALRPAAGHGHPHRDDHRRQPARPPRRSRTRPVSTTSWPRRRPRTRWP